jgi:hypothetical protein
LKVKTEFMSIQDAFILALEKNRKGKQVRVDATDGDSVSLDIRDTSWWIDACDLAQICNQVLSHSDPRWVEFAGRCFMLAAIAGYPPASILEYVVVSYAESERNEYMAEDIPHDLEGLSKELAAWCADV